MSRICEVTGKRPMVGNKVSHANNKTKRRFLPNLHSQRFWLETEKRFVRLRVSRQGLRIIDKKGIEQVIAVVRPANTRAIAMVRRLGMEWVGETDKYHSLRLQVYRLGPADLAPPGYPLQ